MSSKINDLSAATVPLATDITNIVNSPFTPGSDKKITLSALFSGGAFNWATTGNISGNFITSSTGFAVPGNLFLVDDTGSMLVQSIEVVNSLQVDMNGSFECDGYATMGSLTLGSGFGCFGNNPIGQQPSGANLTNNVTSGGTDNTIANYTSLTVYATDAAAIRNNIYQLARKLKQVNDALRLFGLLN